MWLGYRPGDRASSPDDLPGAAQRERWEAAIQTQVERWLESPVALAQCVLHGTCPWRLFERVEQLACPDEGYPLTHEKAEAFFKAPDAITRLGPEAERMLLTYLNERAAEVLRP